MEDMVEKRGEAHGATGDRKDPNNDDGIVAIGGGMVTQIQSHPVPFHSFTDLARELVTSKDTAGKVFGTWYDNKGKVSKEYTFDALWQEAGVVAYHLRNKWGVKKGDLVVLCYDFGLHFFAAFLGCLRAGVTSVLVYPPFPPLVKALSKLEKVISDCNPVLILTDSRVNLLRKADMSNPISKSRAMWPKDLDFKVTDSLRVEGKSGFFKSQQNRCLAYDEMTFAPNDIAFLQYTSGSTGNPKGVMVTQSALLANVKWIHETAVTNKYGYVPTGFSWLPQYHDLGLIFNVIAPFAAGARMHMMSPLSFIKNPLLWIELMSRHKVEWSTAPDFAYQLVARKFQEAKKKTPVGQDPIPNLDLSSIVNLANTAEPTRLDTLMKFNEAFAPYKLRDNWYVGAYGLAECVVGVCWLNEYHLSTPRPEDKGVEYIAIGSRKEFYASLVVKIVDPVTQEELQDGQTGEIWISSPSVAGGYYGKQDLSEETFRARLKEDRDVAYSPKSATYLRSGDLGFFQNDYLFICGRIKDLIISDGVNYYPQDIEWAVQEATPAVRPGCVAAFSSNETSNDGMLEIVFEVRKAHLEKESAHDICFQVREAVIKRVGLIPSRVVAIPERAINKTTSGKIQRRKTRESLHSGAFHVLAEISAANADSQANELGNSNAGTIQSGYPMVSAELSIY